MANVSNNIPNNVSNIAVNEDKIKLFLTSYTPLKEQQFIEMKINDKNETVEDFIYRTLISIFPTLIHKSCWTICLKYGQYKRINHSDKIINLMYKTLICRAHYNEYDIIIDKDIENNSITVPISSIDKIKEIIANKYNWEQNNIIMDDIKQNIIFGYKFPNKPIIVKCSLGKKSDTIQSFINVYHNEKSYKLYVYRDMKTSELLDIIKEKLSISEILQSDIKLKLTPDITLSEQNLFHESSICIGKYFSKNMIIYLKNINSANTAKIYTQSSDTIYTIKQKYQDK